MICRDITERKRAEAELHELNQQLELRVRERTNELEQANEQLKAEIRQRRRKEKIQQAIYQMSQAVPTAKDLDSLYQQIHRTVQGLMRAKNFYLALRERGKDVFAFPYFVDEVDPPPRPMTVTTGLTGYVLRTASSSIGRRDPQEGGELAVLSRRRVKRLTWRRDRPVRVARGPAHGAGSDRRRWPCRITTTKRRMARKEEANLVFRR